MCSKKTFKYSKLFSICIPQPFQYSTMNFLLSFPSFPPPSTFIFSKTLNSFSCSTLKLLKLCLLQRKRLNDENMRGWREILILWRHFSIYQLSNNKKRTFSNSNGIRNWIRNCIVHDRAKKKKIYFVLLLQKFKISLLDAFIEKLLESFAESFIEWKILKFLFIQMMFKYLIKYCRFFSVILRSFFRSMLLKFK